jgi:hypothetical protein
MPALIEKSPFHRFGVRLNQKAETVRDRRISREEEKRLLDAALAMNTWEHRYVGPLMHDRIIGARALLPARRNAAHPEQTRGLGRSHDRHSTKRAKPGARVDRAKLQQIDLHWHDLRHEGACRLLAHGVDIRIVQLMLGGTRACSRRSAT